MKRSCGILLPIASLPSRYGIGSFSESAYDFVLKANAKKLILALMKKVLTMKSFI